MVDRVQTASQILQGSLRAHGNHIGQMREQKMTQRMRSSPRGRMPIDSAAGAGREFSLRLGPPKDAVTKAKGLLSRSWMSVSTRGACAPHAQESARRLRHSRCRYHQET